MKATLYQNDQGLYYELQGENKKDLFFQTDWDYPGLARLCGWDMKEVQRCGWCNKPFHVGENQDCFEEIYQCGRENYCDHDSTDGTVTCKGCGLTTGDFISAAIDWLDDHANETFEIDDDYFEREE